MKLVKKAVHRSHWLYCCLLCWSLASFAETNDDAPKIKTSPSNATKFVDQNHTLICEVYGRSDITWQKRNGTGGRYLLVLRSERVKINKGNLHIIRLLGSDTGFYRCVAENKYGSSYSGTAYLTVHEGQNAYYFEKHLNEEFEWNKNLTADEVNCSSLISKHDRLKANRQIKSAKATIVTPPKNRTVRWGTEVTLSCEVVGIPVPHRSWLKNNVPIIDPSGVVYSQPHLKINATETATYACRAENTHADGHTNVTRKAVITVSDGYCQVYDGEVCSGILTSNLNVHLKFSVENPISAGDEDLKQLLSRLTSPLCRGPALRMLCYIAFPVCPNNQSQRLLPLCKETCLAIKELFCQNEWLELVTNRFGEASRYLNCSSLKYSNSSKCHYIDLFEASKGNTTTTCYEDDGRFYRGPVNLTLSGHQCQAWNKQVPHRHNRYPTVFPMLTGNQCRNAGGERDKPWCYTTNSNSSDIWEYCDVKYCDDIHTTTTKLNDQPNALTPEVAFILGGAVSFIVVAVLLTIGLILRCRHMTKLLLAQKRKQADIQQEDDTNIGMLPIVEIRPPEETELLPHLAYDRNNIYLEKEIGNSSFGQVFISSLNPPLGNFDKGVVRALDKDKPVEMQADFMRQAKILSSLSHPNIIQLLGVCFNGFPYFIIVEYMIHCDLHGYLQKHTSMHHINRNGRFIRQQLSIADQIVLAMEYLGSRRFVHRDLAAHNVFVTEGSDGKIIAKLSDFGLTVELAPDEDYFIDYRPDCTYLVRWMAPEVVKRQIFSCQSDVWSFGVVLWEIFSFAKRPYDEIDNMDCVIDYVAEGKTLECPQDCDLEIYDIMKSCWTMEMDQRPTFANLHKCLRSRLPLAS